MRRKNRLDWKKTIQMLGSASFEKLYTSNDLIIHVKRYFIQNIFKNNYFSFNRLRKVLKILHNVFEALPA